MPTLTLLLLMVQVVKHTEREKTYKDGCDHNGNINWASVPRSSPHWELSVREADGTMIAPGAMEILLLLSQLPVLLQSSCH